MQKRLESGYDNKAVVILERQCNPEFALGACKKYGIARYIFIVIHAERSIRERRLIEQRKQPELVNETMNNWAEVLKRKTLELGGIVIDTSASDVQYNLNEIASAIKGALIITKDA